MTGPRMRKAAEMFFAHPARKDNLCTATVGFYRCSGLAHRFCRSFTWPPVLLVRGQRCKRIPISWRDLIKSHTVFFFFWRCGAVKGSVTPHVHHSWKVLSFHCGQQQWSGGTLLMPQGPLAVCVRRFALACLAQAHRNWITKFLCCCDAAGTGFCQDFECCNRTTISS